MSSKDEFIKHIALVGMTGVGKSTLVNVLNGSNCAKVTNDAEPCTSQVDHHEIEKDGVKYCLWDTRGYNEAWEQEAKGLIARFLRLLRVLREADHELLKFLRGKNPRINLILFCVEAKDIRAEIQWKNYGRIRDEVCRRRIKVAVVVTRMDRDTRNTDWKGMCKGKVREVVGESLDERTVEAVPIFQTLNETRDCRSRILQLICNLS